MFSIKSIDCASNPIAVFDNSFISWEKKREKEWEKKKKKQKKEKKKIKKKGCSPLLDEIILHRKFNLVHIIMNLQIKQ